MDVPFIVTVAIFSLGTCVWREIPGVTQVDGKRTRRRNSSHSITAYSVLEETLSQKLRQYTAVAPGISSHFAGVPGGGRQPELL